jgi:hypothetical protein
MNDSRMLKPALIGGVLLGVLSSLPIISLFNCFCCAWVIVGGVLAAYQYVKESPTPVSLGKGVALGLLTGAIGAVVSALFTIPLHMLTLKGGIGILEQMRSTMDQMPTMPPETRQMIESIFSRGDMGVAIMIVGFLFSLVVFSIFAMVGGAIGVAIFEKRKPGAPPVEGPQYQPPIDLPPVAPPGEGPQ